MPGYLTQPEIEVPLDIRGWSPVGSSIDANRGVRPIYLGIVETNNTNNKIYITPTYSTIDITRDEYFQSLINSGAWTSGTPIPADAPAYIPTRWVLRYTLPAGTYSNIAIDNAITLLNQSQLVNNQTFAFTRVSGDTSFSPSNTTLAAGKGRDDEIDDINFESTLVTLFKADTRNLSNITLSTETIIEVSMPIVLSNTDDYGRQPLPIASQIWTLTINTPAASTTGSTFVDNGHKYITQIPSAMAIRKPSAISTRLYYTTQGDRTGDDDNDHFYVNLTEREIYGASTTGQIINQWRIATNNTTIANTTLLRTPSLGVADDKVILFLQNVEKQTTPWYLRSSFLVPAAAGALVLLGILTLGGILAVSPALVPILLGPTLTNVVAGSVVTLTGLTTTLSPYLIFGTLTILGSLIAGGLYGTAVGVSFSAIQSVLDPIDINLQVLFLLFDILAGDIPSNQRSDIARLVQNALEVEENLNTEAIWIENLPSSGITSNAYRNQAVTIATPGYTGTPDYNFDFNGLTGHIYGHAEAIAQQEPTERNYVTALGSGGTLDETQTNLIKNFDNRFYNSPVSPALSEAMNNYIRTINSYLYNLKQEDIARLPDTGRIRGYRNPSVNNLVPLILSEHENKLIASETDLIGIVSSRRPNRIVNLSIGNSTVTVTLDDFLSLPYLDTRYIYNGDDYTYEHVSDTADYRANPANYLQGIYSTGAICSDGENIYTSAYPIAQCVDLKDGTSPITDSTQLFQVKPFDKPNRIAGNHHFVTDEVNMPILCQLHPTLYPTFLPPNNNQYPEVRDLTIKLGEPMVPFTMPQIYYGKRPNKYNVKLYQYIGEEAVYDPTVWFDEQGTRSMPTASPSIATDTSNWQEVQGGFRTLGLQFNSNAYETLEDVLLNKGVLKGTPSVVGRYAFTVFGADSRGAITTVGYQVELDIQEGVRLPPIGDKTLYLGARATSAVSGALPEATPMLSNINNARYVYTLTLADDSPLPANLSFNNLRRIVATDIFDGDLKYTATRVEGTDNVDKAERTFNLKVIKGEPPPPPINPDDAIIRSTTGNVIFEPLEKVTLTDGVGPFDKTMTAVAKRIITNIDTGRVRVDLGTIDAQGEPTHTFEGEYDVQPLDINTSTIKTTIKGRQTRNSVDMITQILLRMERNIQSIIDHHEPYKEWDKILKGTSTIYPNATTGDDDSLYNFVRTHIGDRPNMNQISSTLYKLGFGLVPQKDSRQVVIVPLWDRDILLTGRQEFSIGYLPFFREPTIIDIERPVIYSYKEGYYNRPSATRNLEIRTFYQDANEASRVESIIGNSADKVILEKSYTTEARAIVAMEMEKTRLNNNSAVITVTLLDGRLWKSIKILDVLKMPAGFTGSDTDINHFRIISKQLIYDKNTKSRVGLNATAIVPSLVTSPT